MLVLSAEESMNGYELNDRIIKSLPFLMSLSISYSLQKFFDFKR